MCGILGQLKPQPSRFETALGSLVWRGRDGRDQTELYSYRIGCQRLAITDPMQGQPLSIGEPGERLSIVMNGSLAFIDKYHASLAAVDETPRTRNDAEIPLRLYRAFGLAGLCRLEGQFAFAILDEERSCLVLGRDAFGEKPLFIAEGENGFPAFASTAKALRELTGELAGEMPVADAVNFARFGWIDLEESCFGLAMQAFPRGELRLYDSAGCVERLALDAPTVRTELPLEDLLMNAVAARLHGDRKLGLFLSSGIDSACLAWACRELGARPLAMTLDFEGLMPESARAAHVASRFELPHRAWIASKDLLQGLPDLIKGGGLPLGDPSILAVHELSRHAVEEGIGIVLCGEGGDELFMGYLRQRGLSWLRLAQNLLPGALRTSLAAVSLGLMPKRLEQGRRMARAFPLTQVHGEDYAELQSLCSAQDLTELFGTKRRALPAAYRWQESNSSRFAAHVDVNAYLAQDLCPKLDHGSLAAGLEARSPFLDQALFAHARAGVQHMAEFHGKRELRALLARVLPNELLQGRKRGFALPLPAWILADDWAKEILSDPALASRACWNRQTALRWLDEMKAGRRSDRAHLLFNLCSLALHLIERGR